MIEKTSIKSDMFPEHLRVASQDEAAWADIWITRSSDGQLSAQSYMEAPKRGDEVMALVQTELQKTSDALHESIKHIITASNKGAAALAQRTEGYVYAGNDNKGHFLYHKMYIPNGQ
jgi:hypothetical protein